MNYLIDNLPKKYWDSCIEDLRKFDVVYSFSPEKNSEIRIFNGRPGGAWVQTESRNIKINNPSKSLIRHESASGTLTYFDVVLLKSRYELRVVLRRFRHSQDVELMPLAIFEENVKGNYRSTELPWMKDIQTDPDTRNSENYSDGLQIGTRRGM